MSDSVRQAPLRAGDVGLAGAWIGLLSLLRASSDKEVDAFWMIREGLGLLAGQPLVHPDTWSWAPVDRPFVPTSPLWQWLLAQAWQFAGLHGVFLLSTLTIALALTMSAVISRMLGANPEFTVVILILTTVLCAPLLVARAAMPALTLFIALILTTTQRHRLRSASPLLALGAVAALFGCATWLGVWLHASWSAYAPVAVIICSAAVVMDRTVPHMLRICTPFAAAIGATLGIAGGPRGFQVYDDAARVAAACRNLVIEWMPPWQVGAFWTVAWCITGVVISATAVSAVRARRQWFAAPQLLLAIAFGAWGMGAVATRFLVTSIYLAIPIAATALLIDANFDRLPNFLRDRLRRRYWRTVLWLVLPVLLPFLALQTANAYAPVLDATLRALPANCNLFSKDDLSSPVLLARPDVRVWIDGRLDYWGRDRMTAADQYLQSKRTDVAPPGTTCLLVRSDKHPPMYPRLAANWQRVASGPIVEVWVPGGGS